MSATATKEGEVKFYSWIHNEPSSLTVRISGGQRVKDSNSGAIMALEHKEVRFNMGLLTTDDPETIEQIRKLIRNGDTITEDKEVYLQHILKPEDLAKRKVAQNSILKSRNEELEKEIAKLNAKLTRRDGGKEAAA